MRLSAVPTHTVRRAAVLVAAVLAGSGTVVAQPASRSTAVASERTLAPGVVYRHVLDPRGPWSVHTVRIDLRRAPAALRVLRARDALRGRERTSAMAARSTAAGDTVLVAVNADFFNLRTGENENNQVLDGEWWKGVKVTDSPYDTWDNVHVQFAMDHTQRPDIDRYVLDGRAWLRGAMLPILAVNFNPAGAPEGSALYTARYGATTPRDTARATAEVAMREAGRAGDTLIYVSTGTVKTGSGATIPDGGAVLAAYGSRTIALDSVHLGDTVRVVLTTLPRLPGGRSPSLLIGGWPRVLREGVNVAGDAAVVEGTISRNAEVRHPRTAIGYSKDRRTLWLYVVDGRSTQSVGMTLVEMADDLRSRGVWNAMNFDGGGSTAMVIDGAVVNTPSDPTGEREVGNALVLVKRPRR